METTCSYVYKDREFLSANWREHMVAGNASKMLVDHIQSGGRDCGPFRQHIQQGKANGDRVTISVVRHTNTQATYNPSSLGPILTIDFDCSLKNIEQSTETHFSLLLEQNNHFFVSKQSIVAKHQRWTNYSLNNLRSTDFMRLVPPNQHDFFSEEHPNFTELGGEIRLGYVTTCTIAQLQDEAASGIEFWRVTISHENAETTHRNLRLMQLEHNTNVLLQELSDMHEHADITRREHATQLASLNALQDDVSRERGGAAQLLRELAALRGAVEYAEAETRASHTETEQLQELVTSMEDDARELVLKLEVAEKTTASAHELQRLLVEQRNRSCALTNRICEYESIISKQSEDIKVQEVEVSRLNAEKEEANDSIKTLKRTVRDLTNDVGKLRKEKEDMIGMYRHSEVQLNEELNKLKTEYENVREYYKNAQETLLTNTKKNTSRLEEELIEERQRRKEAERKLGHAASDLQGEMMAMVARMEADIANERSLRLQLEREHREELSRLENTARAEKTKIEEQLRTEKLAYMHKEAQLLEEKRNLATSLQAATTKSALTEQRLSNQLMSVSALHKSEADKIVQLEAELRQEKETSAFLESQLPKDEDDWEVPMPPKEEEDWEVVDQM